MIWPLRKVGISVLQKRSSSTVRAFAGHEDMIAMWHDVYNIKALNPGRRA